MYGVCSVRAGNGTPELRIEPSSCESSPGAENRTQKLRIQPKVKKIIDDFTKDWDKDNMVGVHVRTNFPPVDDGSRSVRMDFPGCEREIESYPTDQKFFLATDHAPIVERYKAKYGSQIIIH